MLQALRVDLAGFRSRADGHIRMFDFVICSGSLSCTELVDEVHKARIVNQPVILFIPEVVMPVCTIIYSHSMQAPHAWTSQAYTVIVIVAAALRSSSAVNNFPYQARFTSVQRPPTC